MARSPFRLLFLNAAQPAVCPSSSPRKFKSLFRFCAWHDAHDRLARLDPSRLRMAMRDSFLFARATEAGSRNRKVFAMTLKVRFAFLAGYPCFACRAGFAASGTQDHAGRRSGRHCRRLTFLAHRLGTDHAEGVTTLDMNGDGYLRYSQRRVLVRESRPQRRRMEAASISRGRHAGRVRCRLRRVDHRCESRWRA